MKLSLAVSAALLLVTPVTSAYLADCSGGTDEPDAEDCNDGIDNDRDLDVDCADSDCWGGSELLLTEIQMHPTKVADVDGEYVEFYNYGDRCVDISRWTIAEDSGLPPTGLPSNSWVKPGATYVVAGAFYADDNCGVYANASFYYDSTLNDDHDTVILKDSAGNTVMRLEYCNGTQTGGCLGDWPDCPAGASLEYCGPLDASQNAMGDNWICASTAYGCGDLGSPKAINRCE